MLKRLFDISFSLFFMLVFCIPACLIALSIKFTSRGSILFWSQRVGQHNTLFWMPKFRTMCYSTPLVATNCLPNPTGYLTPNGAFLRKFSLDEIPQLWCILVGSMSVVGPRPVLNDESEKVLLTLRTRQGIPALKPGLTGWAQINGRDFLNEREKVALDLFYLQHKSFKFDLRIIFITIKKVLFSHDVKH